MTSALAEHAMDTMHEIAWEDREVLASNPRPHSAVCHRSMAHSISTYIDEQRSRSSPPCLQWTDQQTTL